MKKRTSKEISKGIIESLQDAVRYTKGEKVKGVRISVREIPDIPKYNSRQIRTIRKKRNLTQLSMAKTIGVSKKTVEAWESGRNIPTGPARRLIYLIDKKENFIEAIK